MRTSRLVLRKETLSELCHDELTQVAGGDTTKTTTLVASTADLGCFSDQIAGCDSWLRPCISHTCTR